LGSINSIINLKNEVCIRCIYINFFFELYINVFVFFFAKKLKTTLKIRQGLGHHHIKRLPCLIIDRDSVFGLGFFSKILKDSLSLKANTTSKPYSLFHKRGVIVALFEHNLCGRSICIIFLHKKDGEL
jgi:hypothetical protein